MAQDTAGREIGDAVHTHELDKPVRDAIDAYCRGDEAMIRAITLHCFEGRSLRAIERETGTPRSTISEWVLDFRLYLQDKARRDQARRRGEPEPCDTAAGRRP